jgi:uncharacterized protein YqgV (UPF0045/DUF77 family)
VSECNVTFTIEPFNEDNPGQHVMSGIRAMESSGLNVSMGPFGSTVSGTVHEISGAIGAMVTAAVQDGAGRVLVEVEIDQT